MLFALSLIVMNIAMIGLNRKSRQRLLTGGMITLEKPGNVGTSMSVDCISCAAISGFIDCIFEYTGCDILMRVLFILEKVVNRV